ncbi:Mediator of RNA polymerase II transcription subunit 18 [Pseudocercospora fuligena]|uniref:Mediator of RNA polymerase II transcription subunit 18 n=1 Tax=Pseudocercospora fuligena TaxID=685502 RepID=A0A8H6VNW7_9PEZI|nr:Mediator of RNA polymerase II transcription subunit 18 [Pseudocercospora fuligena]
MREYLLYSQIPHAREVQVLSILAGVTGSQPVSVWQQVAIYGQMKAPDAAVSKKTQAKQQAPKQAPQLNYHKLIRNIDVHEPGEAEAGPWTFRAEALPDPGLTDYIARNYDEHLATEDELQRLRQPELYKFRRQFLTEANRFVHNNVVTRLYRMRQAPESAGKRPQEYTMHSADLSDPISSPAPFPKDQKLIDPSGSWIIEVSIRVEDGNNSTLTDKAKQELLAFKETMDGALDLIAPDRLALDSRVKNV